MDEMKKTEEALVLKNNLKAVRAEKKLSQAQLAELVGVSRNTLRAPKSLCKRQNVRV